MGNIADELADLDTLDSLIKTVSTGVNLEAMSGLGDRKKYVVTVRDQSWGLYTRRGAQEVIDKLAAKHGVDPEWDGEYRSILVDTYGKIREYIISPVDDPEELLIL